MLTRLRQLAAPLGKPLLALRRKLWLFAFCVMLLFISADTLALTPGQRVAASYTFSLLGWEAANFFDKWWHLAIAKLPGDDLSRDERLAALDDYLETARRANKEQRRLESPYAGGSLATGGAARREPPSRDYLDELLAEKGRLRPIAEETLESEFSATLLDAGFGSRFGLIFPPVDIAFQKPPTLLVVSPRDHFHLVDAVMLAPDVPGYERGVIEGEMMERYNLSALVDNLAGLSTYPTLVSDLGQLRFVCRTAAHEWMHVYLFFRPLGQNFRDSEEMFTLNETVADIAGRELGDRVFERMGGDLSVSASRYASVDEAYPFFTQTLRETRAQAGELLDEGKAGRGGGVHETAVVEVAPSRIRPTQAEPGVLRISGPLRRRPCVHQPHRRAGEAGARQVRRRGVVRRVGVGGVELRAVPGNAGGVGVDSGAATPGG